MFRRWDWVRHWVDWAHLCRRKPERELSGLDDITFPQRGHRDGLTVDPGADTCAGIPQIGSAIGCWGNLKVQRVQSITRIERNIASRSFTKGEMPVGEVKSVTAGSDETGHGIKDLRWEKEEIGTPGGTTRHLDHSRTNLVEILEIRIIRKIGLKLS